MEGGREDGTKRKGEGEERWERKGEGRKKEGERCDGLWGGWAKLEE